MIKQATIDDLERIYPILIKAQKNPQLYSGFISENPFRLKEDLIDSLINHRVLIDINGDIQGVLIFSPSFKAGIFDLAGPFVLAEDLNIAKQLTQYFIHAFAQTSQCHFFFRKESQFYRQLMTHIGAVHQSDEYILSLPKDRFKASGQCHIKIAEPEDFDAIQQLHDEIFPTAYIPGEKMIVPTENTALYIVKEDDIIGYAYLKKNQDMMMLEVFALALKYRNQKKSVPFLNSVLHHVFETQDVDEVRLVVEEYNKVAAKIYQQCGFEVYLENVAFQLHPSV